MQRLENGLAIVLEMKTVLQLSRQLVQGDESTFVSDVKALAASAAELVPLLKNHTQVTAESQDFLSDLLLESVYIFERRVVQIIEEKRVSLRNPCALASCYSSYKSTNSMIKATEDLLWLMQLIDSTETEGRHLLSPQQLQERQSVFALVQKMAHDVQSLLELVRERESFSRAEKIEKFQTDVFVLTQSSQEFLSVLKASQVHRTEELVDEIRSSVEGMILFTKHVAHEDEMSFMALQQARSEFVSSVKQVVIGYHKSLNSQLKPPPKPEETKTKVPVQNKRKAVRIVQGGGGENAPHNPRERTLDLGDNYSTAKLRHMLFVLDEAKALYLALQALEFMRDQPWFRDHYEGEESAKKLLCLMKLQQTAVRITGPTFIRKRGTIQQRVASVRNPSTLRPRVNVFGSDSISGEMGEDHRQVLKKMKQSNSTAEITQLTQTTLSLLPKAAAGQREARFNNKKKRLTLKSSTLIESICTFQASMERLLRTFQPQIPSKVDISTIMEASEDSCGCLEEILMLVSMQKNEMATEPPTKLEQSEMLAVFTSLSDISDLAIEPDQDTLRAIGRHSGHVVLRYLLAEMKEIRKQLELLSIQLHSQTRAFHGLKKRGVVDLFRITAIIRMFVHRTQGFIRAAKTYNFATSEINNHTAIPSNNALENDDVPFWEEIVDEADIPRGLPPESMTINQLIGMVTTVGTPNAALQRKFIRNYPSFMSDADLVKKLKQRCEVPGPPQLQNAVRRSVYQFMAMWADSEAQHLDPDLVVEVLELLQQVDHPMNKQTIHRLEETMQPPDMTVKPTPELMGWNPTESFMTLDEDAIAKQLTLIDYSIYVNIHPRELQQAAWSSPKLRHCALHVRQMIDRQNQLAFYITSMIVQGQTLKDRIEIWDKWIRIAVKLEKLNNFNSLMGVIAASNMAVTQRLHHTKNGMKKSSMTKLEMLGKLMAPHKSWATFREALGNCVPPAIPYLGVFLTDITFIHDGNKDFVNGLVNWKKVTLIHRVLETISKFQKVPYCFSVENPAYSMLYQLPSQDDECNYQLSLDREPKKIELKALLAMEKKAS